MKSLSKTLGLVALAVMFVNFSACSSAEEQNDVANTEINSENIIVADYAIDGMVCAMGCAKTIQDEVAGMEGVANCEVNYEEKTAHIEFDGGQLSENDVIAKIESLADGKYKVNELGSNEANEETLKEVEVDNIEEGEDSEESVVEVSLPSFEMPNLFELLFKQL